MVLFAYNAAKDSIKDVNSKGDALAKAWVTYTAMLDCEADPDDSTFPSDWKKTSELTAMKSKQMFIPYLMAIFLIVGLMDMVGNT